MPKNLAAALAITVTLALPAVAHAGRTVSVGPLNQSRADVTFAEGSKAAPDNTILVHLEGLIDRAEAGSHIAGAIFSIVNEGRIEVALRDAAKRGVDIWLVVDDLGEAPTGAAVQDLGIFGDWDAGPRARLHIRECVRGCLSYTPGSIQHMKYFTFSRTRRYVNGDFSPATWISSANLDANTGTNAWNNAVSVFDDPGLNAGMEVAFRDQWNGYAGRWGVDFDYYTWPHPNPKGTEGRGAFIAPTSGTIGIFSPERQTDLWEGQLRMLKGPEEEGGVPDCRVAVLHNHLTDARIEAINELARLSFFGCEVRVMVNFADIDADKCGGHPTACDHVDMGSQAKDVLCNTPGDLRVIAVRKMHHKAIAAYGAFAGSYRATVWTGSHNLTGPALNQHDEIIYRVDNAPKLADEFMTEYVKGFFNTAEDVCTAPAG
ncbi:MAG: phospholipase D-like domain-containing protein [Actinomycetota bacterium]|nr:phospholipase D-like domain-containing protein [Actinomycetota bacterium]